MTTKQLKLIENYIRKVVRKTLNESTKIKVGDNVRIIDKDSENYGKLGLVVDDYFENVVKVKFPSGKKPLPFLRSDVEIIKGG